MALRKIAGPERDIVDIVIGRRADIANAQPERRGCLLLIGELLKNIGKAKTVCSPLTFDNALVDGLLGRPLYGSLANRNLYYRGRHPAGALEHIVAVAFYQVSDRHAFGQSDINKGMVERRRIMKHMPMLTQRVVNDLTLGTARSRYGSANRHAFKVDEFEVIFFLSARDVCVGSDLFHVGFLHGERRAKWSSDQREISCLSLTDRVNRMCGVTNTGFTDRGSMGKGIRWRHFVEVGKQLAVSCVVSAQHRHGRLGTDMHGTSISFQHVETAHIIGQGHVGRHVSLIVRLIFIRTSCQQEESCGKSGLNLVFRHIHRIL